MFNCFINSSGVVRTEDTYNILGSKSDLMTEALPNSETSAMLIRENKGFFSFAFDSAHVKYGV